MSNNPAKDAELARKRLIREKYEELGGLVKNFKEGLLSREEYLDKSSNLLVDISVTERSLFGLVEPLTAELLEYMNNYYTAKELLEKNAVAMLLRCSNAA